MYTNQLTASTRHPWCGTSVTARVIWPWYGVGTLQSVQHASRFDKRCGIWVGLVTRFMYGHGNHLNPSGAASKLYAGVMHSVA
jgi:hypothetical protein